MGNQGTNINSRTILQHIEPILKFSSIILVEPMLSPEGPEYLYPLRNRLIRSAYGERHFTLEIDGISNIAKERRDVWPSRECALQDLKSRPRTARWDPRILELFVVRPIEHRYYETYASYIETRTQKSSRVLLGNPLQWCDASLYTRPGGSKFMPALSCNYLTRTCQAMYRDAECVLTIQTVPEQILI